jgi:hypothetical protein
MKTEDLLRLRELAEKATQGEYYYTEDDSKNTVDGFCYGVVSSEEENDSHSYICHGASVENGNYIASISPSVLIPILDELTEARKVVEFYASEGFETANCGAMVRPIGSYEPFEYRYVKARAHQAKFNGGIE